MTVQDKRPGRFHSPVREELTPGELHATVFLHEVADRGIHCWAYATAGLRKYGHREVAFTLVRHKGEKDGDYPREPLDFFRTLLTAAKKGRELEAGDVTVFERPGLFGFVGAAYTNTPDIPDLLMIGFTEEEVVCAREFGTQRVFSLLARAAQHYPVPYWTERGRESRVSLRALAESVLHHVPRIHDSGFSVYREGQSIVVCPREGPPTEKALAELREIPVDSPVAILTELHPLCDGSLRWEPGQVGGAGGTRRGSPGKWLGGSFLLLRPDLTANDTRILEDGYSLELTKEAYAELREAILARRDLVKPGYRLEWITKEEQAARRCWRRRVLLRETEAETAKAVEIGKLNGFLASIEFTVRDIFHTGPSHGEVRIAVTILHPRGVVYQVAKKGAVEEEAMRRLWDELQTLPLMRVTKTVEFAVDFVIGEERKGATA